MNYKQPIKICACGQPDCDGFKINWPAVRTFRALMRRLWCKLGRPNKVPLGVIGDYLMKISSRYGMKRDDLADHIFIGDNYQATLHMQSEVQIIGIPAELLQEMFADIVDKRDQSRPTIH